MGKRSWVAGAVLALTTIIAVPGADDDILPEDPVYFRFARVRFNENGRFFRYGWAHDYPLLGMVRHGIFPGQPLQ